MHETNRATRWWRLAVLAASALVAGTGSVGLTATAASAAPTTPNLGRNVIIFTASEPQTTIQAALNTIADSQVPISAQFDSNRYAIFFEPGTYGTAADPLVFQVGYYEEVAGLGAMPQDTVINGQIDAFANVLDCSRAAETDCWYNSADNFWRSVSNLQLNVVGKTTAYEPSPPEAGPPVNNPGAVNCWAGKDFWSVSQAAPLRRLLVNGSIVFQQYCTETNYGGTDYASGGFIADSQINGDLNFLGNQQYITRNSKIEGATGCPNGLWNNVYSGVVDPPAPAFTGQCQQNTVLSTSPVIEEEPFFYQDSNGGWDVFVPAVQHNSSGTSWASGSEAGSSIPLSRFFIANPSTPVFEVNAALSLGQNLVLTPGIYHLGSPIVVRRPDTVVLGLGFATLVPQNGNASMVIIPNSGVKLSGFIFDAGAINSRILLSVGTSGFGRGLGTFKSANDPDLIQDVFFRVGGAESPAHANVSFIDNADNSIIDDVWAWRADHGKKATSTGWTANTGGTGLIVTGNNVTAYGLAVEHYQKYEVLWRGQNGTDIFFQNELPYDVPNQAAWEVSPSHPGYPAFDLTNNVQSFHGYGMGSYVTLLNTTALLYNQEPFETPTKPGIQFTDLCTVFVGPSNRGDQSVINGVGGSNIEQASGYIVDVPSYTG